jgi:integrase
MAKAKVALTAAAVARLKGPREIPDGGCPGLYLAIRETGSRGWNFRYRRPDRRPAKLVLGSVDVKGKENGGEPVIGGHLTLAAARVLATEARRLVALGRDPGAEHLADKERRRVVAIERTAKTFAAAAAQFIREYKIPRKNRPPRGWGETARILGLNITADGGEPTLIEGGLAERWRDKPVSEITGHDIYGLIDEARRHGIPGMGRSNKGISDPRGRRMADVLGGMFGFLLQHRRIVVDPTIGMWRPPKPAARSRVLNTKPDVRRADELRWFWAATGKLAEPRGALLKCLLICGARRDELGELRWSELSDDLSMLRLDGSRTKNGRPLELALPPLVQDILRGIKRVEKSPYVFTGGTGKTPVSGWSKIKDRLDELMLDLAREERGKDATIEPWVVHDLRRTAASTMQYLGVRVEVIERALNHVSGSFGGVSGTYQRDPMTDEVRAALERWASHIEGIISGKAAAKVLPLRGRS